MSSNDYYNQNKGPHDQYYPPQGFFFFLCGRTTSDPEQDRPVPMGATTLSSLSRLISREATLSRVVMLPNLSRRSSTCMSFHFLSCGDRPCDRRLRDAQSTAKDQRWRLLGVLGDSPVLLLSRRHVLRSLFHFSSADGSRFGQRYAVDERHRVWLCFSDFILLYSLPRPACMFSVLAKYFMLGSV